MSSGGQRQKKIACLRRPKKHDFAAGLRRQNFASGGGGWQDYINFLPGGGWAFAQVGGIPRLPPWACMMKLMIYPFKFNKKVLWALNLKLRGGNAGKKLMQKV